MRKIIIIVLALAIVLGIVFYLFNPWRSRKDNQNGPATLTVYGLWEDESFIKPAVEAYKKIKPNVTVKYVYQSSINYQKRVQTQILNSEGPDIFMIHQSWLPVFLKPNSLSEMPVSVMTLDEYSKTFYPVVSETLSDYYQIKMKIDKDSSITNKEVAVKNEFAKNGKIYAMARGIDGLALYYNEDILKAVNAGVPKTWEEFRNTAIKTTSKDQKGDITTAGAAMGATGNIDHWSDIIGLLFFQQPGADLEKPNNSAGAEVLKFYTNFITNPGQKVWDINLETDTQAFIKGKLAFYFAPSWRAHEIHSANKDLHFKTAPVPQLPGKTVSWASFWAYAVSAKSPSPAQAWEFLKFLTSPQTQKLLYQEAAKARLFGLPYSAVELQKELITDPVAGAYVAQGPNYKSWYLSSKTHDIGSLDEQMIKYYEDAINSVLQGTSPSSALETAAKGVQQVLDIYVNPATPAPSKK